MSDTHHDLNNYRPNFASSCLDHGSTKHRGITFKRSIVRSRRCKNKSERNRRLPHHFFVFAFLFSASFLSLFMCCMFLSEVFNTSFSTCINILSQKRLKYFQHVATFFNIFSKLFKTLFGIFQHVVLCFLALRTCVKVFPDGTNVCECVCSCVVNVCESVLCCVRQQQDDKTTTK